MIGQLPKKLNIGGKDRAIRSDFRVAILIFQAFNDTELTDQEKAIVMIKCLYEDFDHILYEEYQEAAEKAVWYLDGGNTDDKKPLAKKVMDWEQDEQMIFSAVNKVAGYETRAIKYLHWWTFLGLFNEIGEGILSTVINIRHKKNRGRKLEKHEQEFYRENKQLIDLKTRYTAEEQAEIDYYNKILG
jgi:hypothetical protein